MGIRLSPALTVIVPTDPAASFRADVVRGLSLPKKEIPCKYFYDEAGSRLFDRICELPEYYLTRTELTLMRQHAGEMAELLGRGCLLAEYGSGSSIKTRLLLDHLQAPAAYIPIDISGSHLLEAASRLVAQYPALDVRPMCADFTRSLELPHEGERRRAVYFPGSTLGNFAPGEAIKLLRRTARLVGPGGGLLLGADLKKDPALLHAAYNDGEGVTAAFNLNLLVRINRELGGDFEPTQFWHHALYEPREGRIEMHLVSRREQTVRVGTQAFRFAEGETLRTECSYKYTLAQLRQLAADAGFEVRRVWRDEAGWFSVLYLVSAI